jgi:hypothetical protein
MGKGLKWGDSVKNSQTKRRVSDTFDEPSTIPSGDFSLQAPLDFFQPSPQEPTLLGIP